MSRLIDADALDSVILRLNENGWGITRVDYKLFDRIISEFPTIEPQHWIPCSERLPEENGTVLVTRYEDIEFGMFKDGRWLWLCESGTDYWEEAFDSVIAWMPLPEPYKGENHEK